MLKSSTIEKFAEALHGRLVLPDDADYDDAPGREFCWRFISAGDVLFIIQFSPTYRNIGLNCN